MYTKQQVADLFKKVYENKDLLIFGEEMSNARDMVNKTLHDFKTKNGKYPGILGFDIRKSNLFQLGEDGIEQVVSELTFYAQKGGLITCSAHMANPLRKNPDVDGFRGTLGLDENWIEIMTKGTEANTYFTMELDAIADFLEKLKNNNVPVKYNEEQASYESSVFNNVLSFCIPTTNKNLSRTGIIVDYLTYESYKNLVPRYYDIHVGRKALSQDESRESLALIRDSRGIEVAVPFKWTSDLASALCALAQKGSMEIASTIETYQGACITAIDKTYAEYPTLNKAG